MCFKEKETEKATKLAALSLNWFLQNQNIHLYFWCFSWCIECLKFRHQGIKTRICYQTCACLQNSKWWVGKFCTMHQMNEFASCTFKKNKKMDNIVGIKGHWSWTSWLAEQYCFFFLFTEHRFGILNMILFKRKVDFKLHLGFLSTPCPKQRWSSGKNSPTPPPPPPLCGLSSIPVKASYLSSVCHQFGLQSEDFSPGFPNFSSKVLLLGICMSRHLIQGDNPFHFNQPHDYSTYMQTSTDLKKCVCYRGI